MTGDVRLLLVDGCELTAWLIQRLAPPHVKVELARTFEDARRTLSSDPPHAAIFNITPCDLPWSALAQLCSNHRPPIPFLWCSAVLENPEDLGAGAYPPEAFCHKPVATAELKRQIERLLQQMHDAS